MKSLKEKIEVMQAALDGKEIERNTGTNNGWQPEPDPDWSWDCWDYRIKPEPMEFWINVYVDGEEGVFTHYSEEAAVDFASTRLDLKTIKVREVMNEPR